MRYDRSKIRLISQAEGKQKTLSDLLDSQMMSRLIKKLACGICRRKKQGREPLAGGKDRLEAHRHIYNDPMHSADHHIVYDYEMHYKSCGIK